MRNKEKPNTAPVELGLYSTEDMQDRTMVRSGLAGSYCEKSNISHSRKWKKKIYAEEGG